MNCETRLCLLTFMLQNVCVYLAFAFNVIGVTCESNHSDNCNGKKGRGQISNIFCSEKKIPY